MGVRNGEIREIGYLPPKFFELSPGKFLVELDCGGGAYNTRNAYLFYDETVTPPALKRLRFPYISVEDRRRVVPRRIWATILSGRIFNRRRKVLIVLSKARGLGDAGRFARYVFRDGKPVLKEFRFKLEEDGRYTYDLSGPDAPSPKGRQRMPLE